MRSVVDVERAIAALVRRHMSTDDAAHGLDHIDAVVALAKWIMEEVEVDRRIVLGAAYCHDLKSRGEAGFDRAIEWSIEAAGPLLAEAGYSPDEVERVARCIVTSSWEHFVHGGTPSSPEALVLRDADWLEAMGARGIARVFAFAGRYGLPLRFFEPDPKDPASVEASTDGPDPSPFHHFHSKLLRLKDGLASERAKREGARRHQTMVEFLETYREELRRARPAGG